MSKGTYDNPDSGLNSLGLSPSALNAENKVEDDEFRRRVVQAVISDLKANGPIRHALLGLFPDENQSQ